MIVSLRCHPMLEGRPHAETALTSVYCYEISFKYEVVYHRCVLGKQIRREASQVCVQQTYTIMAVIDGALSPCEYRGIDFP